MYFMKGVRTLVATVFASILLQGIVSGSRYFPRTWINICDKSMSLAPSLGAGRPAVLVQLKCNIQKSDKVRWRLNDLRRWTIDKSINQQTTPANRTVLYNITVTCQVGANISLPWPMKVAGLIELHVTYCLLVDRYGNFMDSVNSKIENDMKVLDIRHSTWLLNKTNRILESSGDSLNLTSDFDCGQSSSLETIITSNVSDTIVDNLEEMLDSTPDSAKPKERKPKLPEVTGDITDGPVRPEDRLINDTTKVVSDDSHLTKDKKNNETTTMTPPAEDVQVTPKQSRQAELDYINLIKQILKTGSKCTFQKLKHFDESIAQVTPLHHFEFLVYGSEYPVLEFMNYSRIGLKEFPKEFSEWRIYFPRLKLLDLTYNYLSELKLANISATPGTGDVVFNLRHNNFTSISIELLQSWAAVDQLVVDIRDNPIHCGCELVSLLPSLEDESTFAGKLAPYRYVRNLRCYTPESLKGRQLYELTTDSLQCSVQKQDSTVVIVLGVLLGILIVTILMILKFKIEIRILLYTRLHVRLPCDSDIHRNNKTFDAFVSYSNEDAAWVFENLLKVLENPQNQEAGHIANGTKNNKEGASSGARSFRLCLHQRDFIAGKTILDNIVDCIESSRHTIIVLSPRFLKSQWSMEELRQAYRQSLVEKSRHLIIILLDKVSKEEMDPLVRRCCKTFTYLEAADSLFKDRLVFSLTTKTKRQTENTRYGQSHQNVYDTLEIPSSPYTYDNKAYFSSGSPKKKDISSSNYNNNNNTYNNSNNYSSFPTNRLSSPLRELSNLSTSSTSVLTKH
ncbi:unnamed protein product [Candidula unifasciata]|uniref:TIR domain-containing protein n=1 Tax=Candidula unifasciata TaxID=100452 RepID=A0A8S3ZAB0_9EUPU|nr:unnamed protein product [Candidula unifasciata]